MENWSAFPKCLQLKSLITCHNLLAKVHLSLGQMMGTLAYNPCFPLLLNLGDESVLYSFDAHNSNLQYISQEIIQSSDHNVTIKCSDHNVLISDPGHANYYLCCPVNALANNTYTSIGFSMMGEKNYGSFVPSVTDIVIEDNACLNEDERNGRSENFDHIQVKPIVFPNKQLQLKRKLDIPELEAHVGDKININSSGNQKKRSVSSKDVPRCMKNAQSRKNRKVEKNVEAEETNAGQTCSSHTSEEDNAYHENNEGVTSTSKSSAALNSNLKPRPSRGSATDPQSLYARKRRERINERLRVLQNLVPNGTKVDICTMLEEAIHYVKLLQLQIKLLSCDDLWMYAPIAYYGFDMELHLKGKLSPPQ
ncbi:unnamed protein product [Lupinus luteus]|uniref:BHLH domain-containing protein n=1 Tax=Lupinus luteus TaxID=3873 RepID=A0AAV1W8Z2_LUPLU